MDMSGMIQKDSPEAHAYERIEEFVQRMLKQVQECEYAIGACTERIEQNSREREGWQKLAEATHAALQMFPKVEEADTVQNGGRY